MYPAYGSSGIDVTQSNPFNSIFLNGVGLDGSNRIVPDVERSEPRLESKQDDVWNLGSMLFGGESLEVGVNLTVSSKGPFLIINDFATGLNAIAIQIEFDDNGSTFAHVVNLNPRIPFIEAQPMKDTEIPFTVFDGYALADRNSISTTWFLQTGNTGATAPFKLLVRLAFSPFTKIYERNYPASLFPPNSLIPIPMKPNFVFPLGTLIHIQYSTANEMILMGSSDPDYGPYIAVDGQSYRFESIATLGLGTDQFLCDANYDFVTDKNGDLLWLGEPLPAGHQEPTLIPPPQFKPLYNITEPG